MCVCVHVYIFACVCLLLWVSLYASVEVYMCRHGVCVFVCVCLSVPLCVLAQGLAEWVLPLSLPFFFF